MRNCALTGPYKPPVYGLLRIFYILVRDAFPFVGEMKNYRIRVSGKVQGVFYRASTLKVASELGINGWVRNEEDGSVLISAEAEEDQLGKLIEWCKQGPPHARVRKVDFSEIDLENYSSFRIVR